MSIEGFQYHAREFLTPDSPAYKKVQVDLAVRLYHDHHVTERVDVDHPRRNTPEVRHDAMEEWGESYSGLFDAYVRDQQGLDVDLSDPKDIADLYTDFKRWADDKRDTIADLDRHGLTT